MNNCKYQDNEQHLQYAYSTNNNNHKDPVIRLIHDEAIKCILEETLGECTYQDAWCSSVESLMDYLKELYWRDDIKTA